ncbi:NAD-dependent epimerase/dehydratase family protein [Brevundimonas lutea]|uniref:NAD-dependent epimerase/dehydratase family protein n=1 Tax=Brevundimonas lutea TaxID=2293980 RepID=UPI003B836A5E
MKHENSPEKVLVTGGAGFIGSHACKALAGAGYRPVVFDDLSNGQMGAAGGWRRPRHRRRGGVPAAS